MKYLNEICPKVNEVNGTTGSCRMLKALLLNNKLTTQLTHLRFKNVSKTSQKTLDNVFM